MAPVGEPNPQTPTPINADADGERKTENMSIDTGESKYPRRLEKP
jgi:hypothetical protein